MSDEAWQRGVEDLADGAFWEAHEGWEDVWRGLPESSAREATQALIQFAAACYKVRQASDDREEAAMQRGMERLLEMGRGHLERAEELKPPETTWDHALLRQKFDRLERILEAWQEDESLDEVVEDVENVADELAEVLQSFEKGVE